MPDSSFSVTEASIAETRMALEQGRVTAVELIHAFLSRIGRFDRQGLRLNSVPVLNPDAFREAAESDGRRRRGEVLGPLDGIPYTAKDSYKVRGMTVAAGSPAFENLIAGDDAFVIERLRAGGAILIGLTNMPPMAAGGMQRGVYGRAESPYNPDFLCSAYGSGSSNGSGTATTSSFATFGLGEETWSSGRAPASNSSLVAYTPSRGVISMRGNWPLYPAMDVVVPHTRSVADLLEVLDVIVGDDSETRGDFWRVQPWVELPKASAVRPESYRALAAGKGSEAGSGGDTPGRCLAGKRIGVPRMYINKDPDSRNPIATRDSVIALWEAAREALEGLGAEVVETDFPAVSNYEEDRPGAESMYTRGIVPPGFIRTEMWELAVWAWNEFLDQNGDPAIRSLDDVDGEKIFPLPAGAIPDHYEDDPDLADLAEFARGRTFRLEELPHIKEAVEGLEEIRQLDFEQWMEAEGVDALVFPAAADVAPFDADFNPASNEIAWRNGVVYSNGNLVIRHLGIPTVTVPMGVMADIGMPVGLTFAGPAYEDTALIQMAVGFEQAHQARVPPPLTPALSSVPREPGEPDPAAPDAAPEVALKASLSTMDDDGKVTLTVEVEVGSAAPVNSVEAAVNGERIELEPGTDATWAGSATLP
ncbi:MAG: amidase, partial [Actinomycetota bacterium]|nr:amidase [Actinomycetota bacterium]